MPYDFPNAPSVGTTVVVDGLTRRYDGTSWKIISTTITGPAGSSGIISVAAPILNTGSSTAASLSLAKLTDSDISDSANISQLKIARMATISKSASYTLSALTEENAMFEFNSATAVTFTVPSDATVNFPVGAQINVMQIGAGQVTVAGATSPNTVTVNATPGLKLRAQWSTATLIKRATNTWILIGDLSA